MNASGGIRYGLRPKVMIVMSSFCGWPAAWLRTSASRALPNSSAFKRIAIHDADRRADQLLVELLADDAVVWGPKQQAAERGS